MWITPVQEEQQKSMNYGDLQIASAKTTLQ
jgi:hypothetical protein